MKTAGFVKVSGPGYDLCKAEFERRVKALQKTPSSLTEEVDFDEMKQLQTEGKWEEIGRIVQDALQKLKERGANFALMPANTTHFAFPYFTSPIYFINIVRVACDECKFQDYNSALVLGTSYTMEGGLYEFGLSSRGINHLIPHRSEIGVLDRIIYDQILKNKTPDVQAVLDIIERNPADAVILACTELPTIIDETNCSVPLVDTTRILAMHAATYAID